MSGTTRLSIALLVGVVATGTFVFVAGVQWPGYFGAIALHSWLGGGLLVVGCLALAEHLQRTGSGAWATALAIVAGGLLAVPTPYVMVLPEEAHDRGPLGWFLESLAALLSGDGAAAFPAVAGLSLAALVFGSGVVTVVGLVSRLRERAASRRTGLALTAVVSWATVSGLLLAVETVATLRPAQVLHGFAGSWAILLLVLHALAKRAAVARWPRAAVVAVGSVGLLGFAGLVVAKDAASYKGLDAEVVAMPQTDAARDQAAAHPRFDPALLNGSQTCGTSGCHEQVTRAWSGSAHAWSARNAYYRKAVGELLWADRWADAVRCAACHDPVVALSGDLTAAYAEGQPPSDSEGVSCLVCHRTVSVDRDPPANGAFSVALVPRYPGDEAAGIRRDARAHQRPFVMPGPIFDNRPCEACHRLELEDHDLVLQDVILGAGDEGPYCRTCHMAPVGRITYSHGFAGINADLPAYADGEHPALAEGAARARAFAGLREAVPLADAGLGDGFLGVSLRQDGDAVVVTTSNDGVGHAFPAGPLDLHQVWMEWQLVGADGAVLQHEGALVGGRIAGTPPRLGGREVDAAGAEIERHAVLDVVAVEDKRVIHEGGSVTDRLPIAGAGTLRVRWLFRRANPDFAAWAGAEVPAWQIAGAELAVSARAPAGDGSAPPASGSDTRSD